MHPHGSPDPEELAKSLTGIGGFFTWAASPGGDLVPLREALVAPALPRRFAAMREALASSTGQDRGSVDERIAVSAVQVGLVSRMWSVALAAAALHGWVPDLSTEVLACGQGHRNPVPLATVAPAGGRRVNGPVEAAEAVADLVLGASVGDITAACADLGHTSRQVLVSNAASALVGAARVLSTHRPEVAEVAGATVFALLDDARLRAGGGFVGRTFTRRGCCLFYRLPGHGLCPDCVLVRPGHPMDEHH